MPSISSIGRSVYGKTIVDLSPQEMASIFEITPYMDTVCKIVYNVLPEKYCAKVIASNNLSVERTSYILSSSYLTDDYSKDLFIDALSLGMTYDRGADILSSSSMPDNRFYLILNSLSTDDFLNIALSSNFHRLNDVLNTDQIEDSRIIQLLKDIDYGTAIQYAKYKVSNFEDIVTAWENATWSDSFGGWIGAAGNVSVMVIAYDGKKFPKSDVSVSLDYRHYYNNVGRSLHIKNSYDSGVYMIIRFTVDWNFTYDSTLSSNVIFAFPVEINGPDPIILFTFSKKSARTSQQVCFSNFWSSCQPISITTGWNMYIDNIRRYSATLSSANSFGIWWGARGKFDLYMCDLSLYGGFET